MADTNVKHIVRIVNTDVSGHKPIVQALRKIKGVSFMYANMVCALAGVTKSEKAGVLPEMQIQQLEKVLQHPDDAGIPTWMRNRRNDYEDGDDKHLVGPTLKFVQDNDVRRLKKIKSNRGMRHAWGLPLRGQRTKSNFRRGKSKKSLGVKRKK
jgi:small subunit ribosomal protein S13